MAALEKTIKLTQAQYNTLAAGGTVGSYTGLNSNYMYLVEDTANYVVVGSDGWVTFSGEGKLKGSHLTLNASNGNVNINATSTSASDGHIILHPASGGCVCFRAGAGGGYESHAFYNGLNAGVKYVLLGSLGTTGDDSNGCSIRITGTIGGWSSNEKTTIDVMIGSRGGVNGYGWYYGPGSLTTRCTIAVYQQSNNTYNIYFVGKANQYWAVDLEVTGYATATVCSKEVNSAYGTEVKNLGNMSMKPLDSHPVGSIYMSMDATPEPGALFGGTWERIKDRFLLAVGDTYTSSGATGGQSSHVHDSSGGDDGLRAEIAFDPGNNAVFAKATGHGVNATQAAIVNSTTWGNWNTTYSTAVVGYTNAATSMPPYYTVYVWRRKN